MKNTALKMVLVFGLIGMSQSVMAAPQGSFELMCRNRAKEVAAETYKNCVTENKQTQIKEVRKDYEKELAAVKSRFENKLKKISKGESVKESTIQSTAPQTSSDDSMTIKYNKPAKDGYIQRSSGARELPMESDYNAPKDQPKNDMSNNTDASSIEIVEIPAEQE